MTKPSSGLSAKQRSSIVKQARAGKDIGKPGKGFAAVAAKATKQYGSEERGRAAAASQMWKQQAKARRGLRRAAGG